MESEKGRILVVDDEESIRFTFQTFLQDEGYHVETAVDYDHAMKTMESSDFDLLYVDIILGGKTGLDLLRDVKQGRLEAEVILITGAPSVESASSALRLGALDYIVKPIRQDTLLRTAAMAFKHMALNRAKEVYRLNLEAIFRGVEDVILTVDEELHLVEINEAGEETFGISRDEALGTSIEAWDFACSELCAQTMRDALARGTTVRLHDIDCSHGHGGRRIADINATPLIRRDGSVVGGILVVRDVTRIHELELELREERATRPIVGRSKEIQRVRESIRVLAENKAPVLIQGAPGTGVERVAQALHATGPWRNRPLVTVDCSMLDESTFERELCGYVRGAFPGADRTRIGKLERAHGGEILFREVADLSPNSQLLLLQILETMEFSRLGDMTPIKVDVRVIASTSADLRGMVSTSDFRRDLYDRLRVGVIELPPLTKRRADISLLIHDRLEQLNAKYGKDVVTVDDGAMDLFLRSDWPHNCRQLDGVVEHAYMLCDRRTISVNHLPHDFVGNIPTHGAGPRNLPWLANLSALVPLDVAERRYLEWAVSQHTGERAELARNLGLSERTLYRKLRELRDDESGDPT